MLFYILEGSKTRLGAVLNYGEIVQLNVSKKERAHQRLSSLDAVPRIEGEGSLLVEINGVAKFEEIYVLTIDEEITTPKDRGH